MEKNPLPTLLGLLTLVTGFVDAVTYLKFGHVFVANMTGNIVFLGFGFAGAPDISIVGSLVAATIAALLGASAYGIIPELGIAMGIQNAVARKLAIPDVTTTVLTMTLTGLAAHLRAPQSC